MFLLTDAQVALHQISDEVVSRLRPRNASDARAYQLTRAHPGTPMLAHPLQEFHHMGVLRARREVSIHAPSRRHEIAFATSAGKVGEEVVARLASLLGAEVKVRLEIEARIPGGVPDKVQRDVTENARTLKFKTAEFE